MPVASPCPSCDASVPPDARFCPQCAAPVSGEGPAASAVGSPDPEAEHRREEALEAALRDVLAPQYQLVRRLGKGGMGSVYLARDPTLKRSVAVKVLSPELAGEDREARDRFRREAQAVAALSHPNVVPIHNVGELDDGTPYFVMQHVEGGNMAERVREEGPLGVDEAKRVLGEVASALAAAHAKGIVHRDVKPANILYDPDSGRVLVSDFGIAAVTAGSEFAGPTRLTRTGTVIGTPEFMSPEQLLGEEVTEKTDMYGLGLVAYELLTGEGAYDATTPQMLFAAHLKDVPRDLGEAREDVDPELRQIARACLAKDPEERPTADELVRRLRPETGPLLEWPPPGLEELQGKLPGTGALLLAGSVAFVLPLAVTVSHGVEGMVRTASFTQLALFFLGGVGALLLVAGAVRLLLQARTAVRAVRLGYTWGTVSEVLADLRKDTGAVVAGSREYASLTPGERGRIRRGRLLGAGALLTAGVLLPIALGAYVLGAARGLVSPGWLWPVTAGPAALLVAGALALWSRERRAVRDARRAFRRRPGLAESTFRLIPVWYENFREVSRGQPGGGGGRRSGLGWAVGTGVVGVLALSAFLLLPATIVAVAGGTVLERSVPRFGNTRAHVQRARVGRRYRFPPDPSITPLEAGEQLLRLATVGGWERSVPYERLPPDLIRPPWLSRPCREAFGDELGDFGESTKEFFSKAVAGFEEGELACLRNLEAHPGYEAFGRVARAPAADVLGARFNLPFPDDMAPHELPIPRYGQLRMGAYGRIGVAALRFHEGDPDAAERMLREVVSVGLLMTDGATLIEALVGAVMAGIGLDGLEALFDAVGRSEEARRLRSARDSVEAVISAVDVERESLGVSGEGRDPEAIRASIFTALRDTSQIRGLRWEMVRQMGIFPCTNARELLFGPTEELRRAYDDARETLVRYPSEVELLRAMEETLERLPRSVDPGPGIWVLAFPGRILGNSRIEGCMTLLELAAF